MMMGLRLDAGVDLVRADEVVPGIARELQPALQRLKGQRLLETDDRRVRATARGLAILNQGAAEFLPVH